MTDVLTPEQRRFNMSRIRGKDTTPELTVRRLVHALGYRYRLHLRILPGSPDLVFPSRRKVIFVHGCFWHRHSCPLGQPKPKTRAAFWMAKLERNVERDRQNRRQLRQLGWKSLVVWGCQTRAPERIRARVRAFLDQPARRRTRPRAK